MNEGNSWEESQNKEMNFAIASEVMGWTVAYRYCEIEPDSGEWREIETYIEWLKDTDGEDDISYRLELDDIQSGGTVKKLCRLEQNQSEVTGEVVSNWYVIDDFQHNPYPVIRKIMEKGYFCRLSMGDRDNFFRCVFYKENERYDATDELDGVAVGRAALAVVNADKVGKEKDSTTENELQCHIENLARMIGKMQEELSRYEWIPIKENCILPEFGQKILIRRPDKSVRSCVFGVDSFEGCTHWMMALDDPDDGIAFWRKVVTGEIDTPV
jgi:hypothetical protein